MSSVTTEMNIVSRTRNPLGTQKPVMFSRVTKAEIDRASYALEVALSFESPYREEAFVTEVLRGLNVPGNN